MNKSKNGFMRRRRRGAFTLVELLVVVAIIALLVSILLPSLGKAKEQARIVVCMSNLKSLGLAYNFYTNAHNDWLPSSAGWGGDPPTWDDRLWPFYENYGLLRCPSDNLLRPSWVLYPRSYAQSMCIGYRASSVFGDNYNPPYGGTPPWTPSYPFNFKIHDLDSPAETIALGEEWESWYYGTEPTAGGYNRFVGSGIEDGMWTSSVPRPVPSRSPTPYHRDKDAYNFLFCDGHVLTLLKTDPKLIDIDGDGTNDPEDMYYYKRRK